MRRFAGGLVAAMDRMNQFAQQFPQHLAVFAIPRIGMFRQELHNTDRVSQSELQAHVFLRPLVFSIGAEVVAAQRSVEFTSQYFDQDIRTAHQRGTKLCRTGLESTMFRVASVFHVPRFIDV